MQFCHQNIKVIEILVILSAVGLKKMHVRIQRPKKAYPTGSGNTFVEKKTSVYFYNKLETRNKVMLAFDEIHPAESLLKHGCRTGVAQPDLPRHLADRCMQHLKTLNLVSKSDNRYPNCEQFIYYHL